MNQIIPSVCALALLSGYAVAQPVTYCEKIVCGKQVVCIMEQEAPYPKPLRKSCGCYDAYREPYRISYPRLCPEPQFVEVGNTPRALAIRQAAVIRQKEIIRFEKGLLAATEPITQPSSTGTTIYGETDGAGVFDNPCAPVPAAYPGTPAARMLRCVPVPAVGEYVSDAAPIATPVPGQAGCVYSPFGQSGYIEVKGLAPGSLAKDPYTGRVFRVP